jgi:hypothetical protein
LCDFHLVEFSHQPVPFPVKPRVETTGLNQAVQV